MLRVGSPTGTTTSRGLESGTRSARDQALPGRTGAASREALYNLSFTYLFQEDNESGERFVREAIELYQEAGDKMGLARARWGLANIEYAKGRGGATEAYDLATAALATFQEVGDKFMTGWATFTVGVSEFLRDNLDEARTRLIAALRLFQEAIDVSGYTLVLDSLAGLTLRQGDPISAATIAGAVATLERTTGTGLNRTNRTFFDWDPAPLLAEPANAEAFARGAAMDTRTAIEFALAVRPS